MELAGDLSDFTLAKTPAKTIPILKRSFKRASHEFVSSLPSYTTLSQRICELAHTSIVPGSGAPLDAGIRLESYQGPPTHAGTVS